MEVDPLYAFLRGVKAYHGTTKTKLQKFAEHRNKTRDDYLKTRRNMMDLSPIKKQQPEKKEPSRLELLREWQKKRNAMRAQQKQEKKKPFKVTRANIESNLVKVYGTLKGVPIKINKTNATPSIYKFAPSTHKFKPPVNIKPINLVNSKETVDSNSECRKKLNFENETTKKDNKLMVKTDRVLRSQSNKNNKPLPTKTVKTTKEKPEIKNPLAEPKKKLTTKSSKTKVASEVPTTSKISIKTTKRMSLGNKKLKSSSQKIDVTKNSESRKKAVSVKMSEEDSENQPSILIKKRRSKNKRKSTKNMKPEEVIGSQPSTSGTRKSKRKSASVKMSEEVPENHSNDPLIEIIENQPTILRKKRKSESNQKGKSIEFGKFGEDHLEMENQPSTSTSILETGSKANRKSFIIKFSESEEDETIIDENPQKRRSSLFKTPKNNMNSRKSRKGTPGLVLKNKKSEDEKTSDEEYYSAHDIKDAATTTSTTISSGEWQSCVELTITNNTSESRSTFTNIEEINSGNKSLVDTSTISPSLNKVTYVSPFVTMSRGKKDARHEYKSRMSAGGFSARSPNSTNSKAGAEYFSLILKKEVNRLRDMCDEWENYKNTDNIPEEAESMINVAIGQSHLLLNKRLTQFKNMIESCRLESTTPLITCTDLHGYWESLLIQVRNIDNRFENLSRLKSNNWEEIIPEKIEVVKKKTLRPARKPKVVSKPAATSSLREAIRLAKEKKLNNLEANKEIDIKTPGKGRKSLLQNAIMNSRKSGSPGLFMIQASQTSKIVTPSKSILKTNGTASSNRKSKAVAFRRSILCSDDLDKENNDTQSPEVKAPQTRLRASKLF